MWKLYSSYGQKPGAPVDVQVWPTLAVPSLGKNFFSWSPQDKTVKKKNMNKKKNPLRSLQRAEKRKARSYGEFCRRVEIVGQNPHTATAPEQGRWSQRLAHVRLRMGQGLVSWPPALCRMQVLLLRMQPGQCLSKNQRGQQDQEQLQLYFHWGTIRAAVFNSSVFPQLCHLNF